MPLPIHPNAENKVRHILCAKDRGITLEEVMKGEIDGKQHETCMNNEGEELIQLHKPLGVKMDVTATPFYVVDGVSVTGADTAKIQQLLGKN